MIRTIDHDGKKFHLSFDAYGVHVREHYGRDERVISLLELATGKKSLSPIRANQSLKPDSIAEKLDVAACDLALLAGRVHLKEMVDSQSLREVKKSVTAALRIVQSLQIVS